MMLRVLLVLAVGAGVSACQPQVPDSARGVGFDGSFEAQQQRRNAALSQTIVAPPAVTSAPLSAMNDGSAAATAAETQRVLAATRNTGTNSGGVAPSGSTAGNSAPAVQNSEGISRENNFDAVSAQRDIQGDRARIAANRAQYQVIQPEALPSRTGQDGPNLVTYALASRHPVGTQVYRRFGRIDSARYKRACAKFERPDQAQTEFLVRGGPKRDRAGMDPDGDGFACDWDPAPFRNASNG